jgi:hypothetical protein
VLRCKDAAVAITATFALSFSIFVLRGVSPANSASWLTNGSFDNGTLGWTVSGSLAEGCGAGAAGLIANDDGSRLSQNVAGNFGAGSYRLSGRVRATDDTEATVHARLSDLNSSSSKSASTTPTNTYAGFDLQLELPASTTGMNVSITVISNGSTTICVDDVVLEGPLGPSTPTETATSVPPTATSTTVASTPTQTSTSVPSTSTPPAATATTVVATSTVGASTATPESTATSGPSFVFTNGGFEDDTAGWRTNGGEVEAVSSPKRSGGAAGRYRSESATTKWLYQVVLVDSTKNYEFQGALMAEGAVAEAYLRISWYASSDGSGQLIASDDSPASVTPGGGFMSLTTGPVTPPAGARSARVRIMVAPASGASAAVYLDDFSFGTTTAPPATATATPPAATQTAIAREATREATRTADEADDEPLVVVTNERGTPRPATTAEARSIRATATSEARQTSGTGEVIRTSRASGSAGTTSPPEDLLAEERQDEPAPLWPYLAIPGAALAGLAGLVYSRSMRRP